MKRFLLVFCVVFLGGVLKAEELPVELEAEILVEEPEVNVKATLEDAEKEVKEFCEQQKLSRKDEKQALKTLKELVEKEIPVETASQIIFQAISLREVDEVSKEAKRLVEVVEKAEGKDKEELKNAISRAVEKGIPVDVLTDIAEEKILLKDKEDISASDVSEAIDVLSELVEKGIPVEHAKEVVETALEDGRDVSEVAKDIEDIKKEIEEKEEVEIEKPETKELEEVIQDVKMEEEVDFNLTDEEKSAIENEIKEKEEEIIQNPDDGDYQSPDSGDYQYPDSGDYQLAQ
ncbi:MAG: hypothetical protein J7L42_02225 [Elusimicrobia bacterium]|nr:hypothetical protein [Elusimicrobiota bacterium]